MYVASCRARIGGLRACFLVTMLILAVTVSHSAPAQAASDPPLYLEATLTWVSSVEDGDGTFTHDFDLTLTNPGLEQFDALKIALVDLMPLSLAPYENTLEVGTLIPLDAVTLSWAITAWSDLDPTISGHILPILAGETDNGFGGRQGVAIIANLGDGQ